MNNYKELSDSSVTDLVWNEDFRRWVLYPDEQSDFFWKKWLDENQEKKQVVNAARQIISSLIIKEPELSEDEISNEIKNIIIEIDITEINTYRKAGIRSIFYNKYWQVGLAASVIVIIAVSFLLNTTKKGGAPAAYNEKVERPKPELTEKINGSSVAQIIMLPYGSKVVLEKNSKITYSTAFNNLPKRKLYLSGTALFEVHKNPAKPFLVFTSGLITEVLGTKFIIHSIDSGKKVSVEVISGIVSVYSFIDKGSNEETGHKKLNSLILTVNQKASYSGEDKTLMASIVSNPVVVSTQPINFRYENTSIDSVFKSIEQAYGINIIFDEKSLAKRTFTATLTTETMFEKMDIICKALNARYEIIDGKIAVNPNVVDQ